MTIIGRYRDATESARELIACRGCAGSLLVLDRPFPERGAELLVAHLAADEPWENVDVVCRSFLEADPVARRCRPARPEDFEAGPEWAQHVQVVERVPGAVRVGGFSFQVEHLPSRMSIPELRWTRRPHRASGALPGDVVSLRDVIAALEDYEPCCQITRALLDRFEADLAVSTSVLRAELSRVLESPIVLNRGLRLAVLRRVASGETSMSEIAVRCGRLKRDGRGRSSGETSWLACRIGLLPEGGQRTPTPWVHSDVLGLIARRGLGISPREVELG